MRKIKQIATGHNSRQRGDLFAVCEDGTLWQKQFSDVDGGHYRDWEFIPGPADGEPDRQPLTEEETLEAMNKHTGTFISEKLRGDDDV